jgi:hypothetical protein
LTQHHFQLAETGANPGELVEGTLKGAILELFLAISWQVCRGLISLAH